MPLKHHNPFETIHENIDLSVNPYANELISASRHQTLPVAYGPDLIDKRGNWREFIGSWNQTGKIPEKLILEIGCHLGQVTRKIARDFPEVGVIGMDITFKRVMKTVKMAQADGLNNLASVFANASGLDQLFAPGELDAVVIFFPDPWAKKDRQTKNRLINDDFAKKLAQVLSNDGFVWFKTDHMPYFESAMASFENAGLFNNTSESWLSKLEYKSTFEKKFEKLGIPKNESILTKHILN